VQGDLPFANLRGLAAPVVFVCGERGLEWWQQSTVRPRRKGSIIPPDLLPGFSRKIRMNSDRTYFTGRRLGGGSTKNSSSHLLISA
jgi:hypothetical protein